MLFAIRPTKTRVRVSISLLAVGAAGCAGDMPTRSLTDSESRGGVRHSSATFVSDDADSIAGRLESLGPVGRAFHAHVTTLSNPYFEGRGPGTVGIERAAEYLEFYFETYGLTPAFEGVQTTPDGSEIITPSGSFLQPFEVQGKTLVEEAQFSWRAGSRGADLAFPSDFTPLGFSGNGSLDLPLAFVGYSIAGGPDGYATYEVDTDLTGKIALILRFEPMDDRGRSRWSEDRGWSGAASLLAKLDAAEKRGAAGFILVNPPGADDPRADELMTVENSSFRFSAEQPAVMLSTDTADAMVRAMDPQGRSLMELRRLADQRGGVIDLQGRARINVDLEQERIVTSNVGAVLPGKGDLADEYLVIGAHYDHLGYGGRGSRSPQARGEIHAGADDNASGTAGVLILAGELARAYDDMPEDADARSVLFLLFSAEEMGLLGSRHYVEEPSVTLSRINVMFNMDMIGRLDDELEINGVGTAEGLADLVAAVADGDADIRIAADRGGQVGMDLPITTNDSGYAPTDQTSFVRENIPVLGFFTGLHTEYHTVNDVASTVNHEGAVRVLALVERLAYSLATDPVKLTYVETRPQMRTGGDTGRQAPVRLGVMPAGYGDDAAGVGVGEVFEGTTAAEGGVKKGDRIIRWGGQPLAGPGDMMAKLRDHQPGDKVKIVVLRDGEEVELDLTMQAREGER